MADRELRPDQVGVTDRSVGRLQRALRVAKEKGVFGVLGLLRTYGIRESIRFVARNVRFVVAVRADRRFDRKFGVDTGGSIQLDALNIPGPNKLLGNEYVSTSPKSFAWIMRYIRDYCVGSVFIDIGAGKGRTLLLASEYPFSRIVGVEFAEELARAAQRNCQSFHSPTQRCWNFEIVQADAADFAFPPDKLVIYFYNPFSQEVFETVLNNLLASLRAHPRECCLLYATTSYETLDWVRSLVARSQAFEEIPADPMPLYLDAVRSIEFVIFKTR